LVLNKGRLVVDVRDAESVRATVVIHRGQQRVEILDLNTKHTTALEVGEYGLELADAEPGLELTARSVTLRRGETVVVQVRLEGLPAAPDDQGGGPATHLVWLWNAATGEKIRRWDDVPTRIRCLAAAPDGAHVLSASFDGLIRLWDVTTGRVVRVFQPGHSKWATTVAYAPNGMLAISGGWDNTARLWDVGTGREVATFKGHEDSVECVAFAPDGKSAVSGGHDKTLRLWDVASRKEIAVFRGHSDIVFCVAFSAVGKHVVSGSADSTIRIWPLPPGTGPSGG
jgi:WD40 repeat protein